MHSCLLRRPSFYGIHVQKALTEVDEGSPVVHLCGMRRQRPSLVCLIPPHKLTLLHFVGLTRPGFERGHRRLLDDLRQRIGLEVLLAGLFLCVVFTGILLDILQLVLLLPEGIDVVIKELARLLAHI